MSELYEEQSQENEAMLAKLAPARFSRRTALLGGGAGALALIAAACGSDDEEPAATGDATTTTAAPETDSDTEEDPVEPEGGGDLAVAMVAASLEVLAVNTYGAALDAAGSGALGEVPPAVAEFVTTAQSHHQAHLDGWNALLVELGEEEVTEPPADLEETVNEAFGDVTDVVGAAELALMLEQIAAATYLAVIPTLTEPAAIELASQIHPIDMQHAAVLLFVLGEYPVPDVFGSTEQAYTA